MKTGRGFAVVGSSPTTSAETDSCVPGVIGSTAGSNPVGQGSSPWGHALSEPSLTIWAHRPIAGRRLRTPKIPVQTRVGPFDDTVPWSNGNDTWVTSRKRWFNSIRGYLLAQVRQSEERLGLNPGGCKFDSGPGHGPVGKLADHLGLEPGMLRVRLPPGPLETHRPRGAAWSARLPVTQEIAGSNPVEGAE